MFSWMPDLSFFDLYFETEPEIQLLTTSMKPTAIEDFQEHKTKNVSDSKTVLNNKYVNLLMICNGDDIYEIKGKVVIVGFENLKDSAL